MSCIGGLGYGSIYRVLALQAKYQSSVFNIHVKNQVWRYVTIIPALGRRKQEDLCGLLASFGKSRSSKFCGWLCLKRSSIDWESHLMLTFVLHTQMHTSTFTHMHTHKKYIYTHMHRDTHRHIYTHQYIQIQNGKQMNGSLLSSFNYFPQFHIINNKIPQSCKVININLHRFCLLYSYL